MASRIDMDNAAAPGTPATGITSIYMGTDKKAHTIDDTGLITNFSPPTDTDGLPEGATNLYFTSERAQDSVGTILTDTATIDFTYNDPANTISADVKLLSLTDAQIAAAAAITLSKLAALATGKLIVSDGSGFLTTSVTTAAEAAFLSGVTSSIQAQINGKEPTITVLPIAKGGTNAATIPAARVSLNIESRTTVSNADYTIVAADRDVAQIGTMSAPRMWTLPLASSVNPGQMLIVSDESGTVTSTNLITVSRAGADTINGATSFILAQAYGVVMLISDGASKWTLNILGVRRGGTGLITPPTDGQLLIGRTSDGSFVLSTLIAGAGMTITNGGGTITVANTSSSDVALPNGILGDGVDGDVIISGNTTLVRDMFYNNLTVNAGFTLNPGGFIIFVKGTLTVQATAFISRVGTNGGNGGAGTFPGSVPTGGTAGAAGAAVAGTTVGASQAGVIGAVGGGAGSGSSGGTPGAFTAEGASGGVGGNGGTGAGGVGGSGGNSGAITLRYFRVVQTNWRYTAVGTFMGAGGGGAAGAGGGGSAGGGGGGGGAGASGGGAIFILCNILVNNGTIQSNGGIGGNGGAGFAAGNGGGGAGGGGGGGGKIQILANTLTTRGTILVNGGTFGAGGAGAGTGTAGSTGGAGSQGYATTFEASTTTWTTTQ